MQLEDVTYLQRVQHMSVVSSWVIVVIIIFFFEVINILFLYITQLVVVIGRHL